MTRKQQKASVLPYLEIKSNQEVDAKGKHKAYELIIENNGLGPAFVDEVSVFKNNEEVAGNVAEVIYHSKIEGKFSTSDIEKGTLIPSGKTIKHISTDDITNASIIAELINKKKLI